MEYKLIGDYKKDPVMRASFNELAGTVFGIDFEKWYRLGFWNDRYFCYSFEYGGQVVANVSANPMELLVDGKRWKALQIGTVMTHPEHRRKGLAERLMNTVLVEYECRSDLIFLFGNLDSTEFYSRFSFDTARETQFRSVIPIWGSPETSSRKLDLCSTEDMELLRRLTSKRIPMSSAFDVAHTEGILQWHCLNVFPMDLHYVEALDTIVVYRLSGGKVDLYDVISEKKPQLGEILGSVLPAGEYEVDFHFTPEFDGVDLVKTPYITDEYTFYVKSDRVRLEGEFFYPHTAHA